MDLEEMVFRIRPGDGLVVRFDAAAAFVLPGGNGDDAMATELLQMILTALDRGGLPGRRLARQVAGWLAQADPDDVPAFCMLAQAENGVAVIVHGAVDLAVRGPDIDEVLSGSRVATWVDRILDVPFETLDVAPTGRSSLPIDERSDLRAGIVPGGGFSALVAAIPSTADKRAEAEPRPDKAKEQRKPAAPPPESKVEARPPPPGPVVAEAAPTPHAGEAAPGPLAARAAPTPDDTALQPRGPVVAEQPEPPPPSFESVPLGGAEPEEPREPLPIASEQRAAAVAEAVEEDELGQLVEGVVCSRGHFNDPSAPYCAVCGISMVHRTLNLVPGKRPPLGVIVFDDGATYNLDGGYVVGRDPGRDEAVTSNRLRPLVLDDEGRTVSRVHAHVVLDGWDVKVIDRGSANGTYMARPGEATWSPLAPHQATTINPGTRVRVGDREFLFDSHHKE